MIVSQCKPMHMSHCIFIVSFKRDNEILNLQFCDVFNSLFFAVNIVRGNMASKVINFYGHGNHFKGNILDNIFARNVVPSSTIGSHAILVMGGYFLIYDDNLAQIEDIWQIHNNIFHNPLSQYEMSTVALSSNDTQAFKINATKNFFTLDGESSLSSSLIDDRLFDDNEGLNPEVIFQPYLTEVLAVPTARPTVRCYSRARKVRVQATTGKQIQFFEFKVYSSGTNIALQGTATQSSDYNDKTFASNAIDGNNSTFSHTKDSNAFWEVDLGNTFNVDGVLIFNRYCRLDPADPLECLCRLSGANLVLLDEHNSVLTSTTLGNTCGSLVVSESFISCFSDSKTPSKSPSKNLTATPSTSPTVLSYSRVRRVRIQSTGGKQIQLFEFQVYSSGTNIALQGTAIQSSDFNTRSYASNAIDGSNITFSHTKDSNAFLEVDLGENFEINSVVIVNRYCGSDPSDPRKCLCRLSGATLILLDENNLVLAARTIGNTCNQHIVTMVLNKQ